MVLLFFFFQAEDGIRDYKVTGVQTCALPISQLDVFRIVAVEVFQREVRSHIAHFRHAHGRIPFLDRKSTRLNSSHLVISYAVFCLKKKKKYRRSSCLNIYSSSYYTIYGANYT